MPSDVPKVNEQEEAPKVEAYYPGPGGLAGPVQPDYLMPPEPTSLIELRDRRAELRDMGYDLRIEEREAK